METVLPASNKFLCRALEVEARLLSHMDLKVGSSLAVLARRPSYS
jgi:hypothetical protein